MRAWLKFKANVRALARVLRRSRRQQWLAVEAFLTLLGVKVMLNFIPFERWRRIMQKPVQFEVPTDYERIAEVVWAVDQVSQRWSGAMTCLPRAIAVRKMMARRHWDCTLEIGVARDESGQFAAHAWVERGGEVLIGNVPNIERYARLNGMREARAPESEHS